MDQPSVAFKSEGEVIVAQSDSATPWTVAHQAPLSMESSTREYWNGLPFPSPGDLPDQEIDPGSLALRVDSLPPESPGKPFSCLYWALFSAASNSEQRAASHHLIKSEHTHADQTRDIGFTPLG